MEKPQEENKFTDDPPEGEEPESMEELLARFT